MSAPPSARSLALKAAATRFFAAANSDVHAGLDTIASDLLDQCGGFWDEHEEALRAAGFGPADAEAVMALTVGWLLGLMEFTQTRATDEAVVDAIGERLVVASVAAALSAAMTHKVHQHDGEVPH